MFGKVILAAVLIGSVMGAPQIASAKNAESMLDESGVSQLSSISSEDLGSVSGGAELVSISSATVNSSISDNAIGSVGNTGGILGNTLSDNSGMTTLIANSGNQVSISQSTVVNVFMH